jgi:hypothetical protein
LRQEIKQLQHAVFEACQPPPPPPNLRTVGVEETQATQFFASRLSPCPDRPGQAPCRDNDIPLVAGKATVLRAYVDVLAHPTEPITALTGVLETRPSGSPSPQIPITPYNAPIPPRRADQISRRNANDTLNFRMPATRCHGRVDIRLTVFDALHPAESGFTAAPVVRTLEFVDTAPLKIRLVRIHYANAARGMDIPPPTTADFWTTAQLTLRTYPIPGIVLVRDSVELYDGDFTSFFASGGPAAQGTTGTIFEILANLLNAENLSGDVHYVALIPGFPANHTGASGWAVSRKQIAEVFDGHALAQEVAHDSGFPHHAPGCGAGDPDPNYPVYDSYPSASIGEFGFDIVDSVVFDPAVTRDFMSYCGNPWVSPYTYLGLLRTFSSAARTAPGLTPSNQEVLTFTFSVFRNGKVNHFGTGFHAVGPVVSENGQQTRYAAELHDKDGNPLVRQRLRFNDPYQTFEDAQLDFLVAMPFHAQATSLVITREEETIYTRAVGKSAPVVKIKPLRGAAVLSGRVTVSWVASGAGHDRWRYVLRYSNDDGQTWFGLATRLTTTEYTVDFDELPGGERCLIQVLAVADLRTGVATSEPFQVRVKAPVVEILTPHSGDAFEQGQPVAFFGFARSVAGSGDSDALNWSSSIDGFLGSGMQIDSSSLTPGRHRITLSADDGARGESTTSIYIKVAPFRDRVPSRH